MSDDNDGKEIVYDAIVIGLGGVGSFALRSLARGKEGRAAPPHRSRTSSSHGDAPWKVLGLERFRIGHDLGSSHGGTRLFRHAYFEHPSYVPLCLRSTETFRALSDWKRQQKPTTTTGNDTDTDTDTDPAIPLLEECGVLVISDGGADGRTYEVIERCSESARLFGIPTQRLEASDLDKLYGNSFSIPAPETNSTLQGLLEPGAGFVRPELAIQYALEDARCHGATIREGVQVVGIRELDCDRDRNDDDDKSSSPRNHPMYAIDTSDGHTFRSHGVIVSAGAWASKLLPELDPYLTVTRQIQAWFELPSNDDASTNSKLPPVGWFLDRVQDPIPIYGIPADPHSQHPRRSKIALHGRSNPFDPERWHTTHNNDGSFRRPRVTDQELDELKDTVRDWIPGAADGIVQAKACLYTMTPDEHFLVDRCQELKPPDGNDKDKDKPRPSNVWYAAGLSGHGFKMTPALGEALADLVVSGTTDLPVDFLKKARLLAKPQHE